MKAPVVIQIALNCVLALVPAALSLAQGQTGLSVPVMLASPLLWVVSFSVCCLTFRPRKRALWLLTLIPIAFGPDCFMALLVVGLSRNGI
jgi:hypothetical protein